MEGNTVRRAHFGYMATGAGGTASIVRVDRTRTTLGRANAGFRNSRYPFLRFAKGSSMSAPQISNTGAAKFLGTQI